MKSSEEVLALINHVRHKKVDGVLYLMSERLAWSMEKTQSFALSYKYSDIKTQKISPEGKVKIQLQIVLYNGETFNFHFNSPEGGAQQLKDRQKVKDFLQQLLPRFRKQIDAQLEEKNLLLQKNPQLFTLYKELVVTQIITPEEFWENYAPKYRQASDIKNNSAVASSTSSQSNQNTTSQSIGVSGSYLSDLMPQSDGANGIKYNLTADIIDSIFRIYPSVKKKHEENVPHNISEIEFWTKFFQSHYFHRDRNLTRQSSHSKDYFFADCVKVDEQIIQTEIDKGEPDPLLNIDNFDDEMSYSEPIFDPFSEISNQNLTLIQRFNQHSILLSQATLPKRKVTTHHAHEMTEIGKVQNDKITNSSVINCDIIEKETQAPMKVDAQATIQKKLRLEYEDLIDPTDIKQTSNGNLDLNGDPTNIKKLLISHPEEFLSGPANFSSQNDVNADIIAKAILNPRFLVDCRQKFSQSLLTLTNDFCLDETLLSKYSTIALNDLSPNGRLTSTTSNNPDITNLLPDSTIADVKRAYIALNELLRHFYACFPVTSPALEAKLERMKTSLTNFYGIRIKAIEESVKKSPHPHIKVTEHLSYMIRSALEKYAAWVKRKALLGQQQHSISKPPQS